MKGQSISLYELAIKIPEDVVFEKVGDEMVLLNLETGIYFGLNPVGSRMWELLSTLNNVESVVERMRDEFDVSRETLELDLASLIRELTEKKLIKTM